MSRLHHIGGQNLDPPLHKKLRSLLQSHLLNKYLMENFIFGAVHVSAVLRSRYLDVFCKIYVFLKNSQNSDCWLVSLISTDCSTCIFP